MKSCGVLPQKRVGVAGYAFVRYSRIRKASTEMGGLIKIFF
jgi:hypothetical protein